jgi:lipopolysaccharide transport system ATP-binding protein
MSAQGMAIRVEGLGKRYRIGGPREPYGTLRDTIASAVKAPFRAIRGQRIVKQDFWALKGISFEVMEGDVLGIIGRNGAGKSTLLKILSKVTRPTRGRAEVRGRVGSLLDVGTGFHPELTGRENVFLNGAVLGMRRAEIRRKFDEIVAFAETAEFLDVPVKRYSSGMYTRLAFSVAAHLEPDILIVDEVLAVGDAAFQKKCLGKMRTVAREGRTVLFVSHNTAAIRNLCSSAVVLDRGEIVHRGSAGECISFYSEMTSRERGASWTRPSGGEEQRLVITRVDSTLSGEQPAMTLGLEILLESRSAHKPAFLAVDIADLAGTVLMQALPRPEGFIQDAERHHRVQVEIELPPLLPGEYLVSVWLGTHHTETLDEVKEVVAFEVVESPTKGRTYPHDWDHGYLVPRSTARLVHGGR